MLVVPLQPVPNQTLQVQLGNQPVVLDVRQTLYGLSMDVYVGAELVVGGVLCQNLNRIVRYAYLGFVGDLAFADLQGSDDPVYTGFGARFVLLYFEEGELPAAEG